MLRAGTLTRTVSLMRRSTGQDELGQPIDTWAEYARVAAYVKMLSGKEMMLADSDVGIGNASVRIRYRTDVATGDRAIIDGQTFEVAMPLPNYAGRDYVDLVCTVNTE
ncbi:phage head closure protein [Paraburkholderia tropica]|uniref:phage head closure protein n=1 Tax=Paraburkholderia tropica TaxID=92647 RepID=UPI00160D056F|nr:phage head closure protein [Paraburkholderia tropica]MBB2977677.1 SPP1 family predicted phage head-tail adaptor [Paraburkholderia tropica]